MLTPPAAAAGITATIIPLPFERGVPRVVEAATAITVVMILVCIIAPKIIRPPAVGPAAAALMTAMRFIFIMNAMTPVER